MRPRTPIPKTMRKKNLVLLGVLIALIVVIYFISVMRMRMGG